MSKKKKHHEYLNELESPIPTEPVAKEPDEYETVGVYDWCCECGVVHNLANECPPTTPATPAAQPTGELTIILRNCPFCGGKAVYQEILDRDDLNYGGEYIECQSCKATTNLQFSTMDAAAPLLAERWNQRVGEARCDCCDSWVKLPNELCEECKGDDH